MSDKVSATIPNDAFAPYRDYEYVKRICREHLNGCPGITFEIRTRYLALAMAGEAGEAANIVKKQWRGDLSAGNIQCDDQALIKEAADTANYAWMLLTHLGVDPIQEMKKALDGYEEKMKARSLERKRLEGESIGAFMHLRPATEDEFSLTSVLDKIYELLDQVKKLQR